MQHRQTRITPRTWRRNGGFGGPPRTMMSLRLRHSPMIIRFRSRKCSTAPRDQGIAIARDHSPLGYPADLSLPRIEPGEIRLGATPGALIRRLRPRLR